MHDFVLQEVKEWDDAAASTQQLIDLCGCVTQFARKCTENGKVHHPNKMEVIMWKNWKDIVAIMQNAISKEAKQELLHPSGFVTAIEQVSKHKKLTVFQNIMRNIYLF